MTVKIMSVSSVTSETLINLSFVISYSPTVNKSRVFDLFYILCLPHLVPNHSSLSVLIS